MSVNLDKPDREHLSQLLLDSDVVSDGRSAKAFLNDALEGSPRASDIKRKIDLGGNPGVTASEVISKFCKFGTDMPGREALSLLLDELKKHVGEDEGQAEFINGLFVKYALTSSFNAGEAQNPNAFERLIQQTNSFLDVAAWAEKLQSITKQVCKIEAPPYVGTGFLVAPDVVMTNWHVVEHVINKQAEPETVTLRFDYVTTDGHTQPTQGEAFKLSQNWLIDSAPLDEVDDLPDPKPREATPDKLDYALLRLAGHPGKTRGWVKEINTQHDFKANPALFIVQHPKGQPMKLALDTEAVVKANRNGTRVRYRTNTEPGSSGSPCFNQNWELVALHHSGEPKTVATWNEGIPLAAIHTLLTQRKFWPLPQTTPPSTEAQTASAPAANETQASTAAQLAQPAANAVDKLALKMALMQFFSHSELSTLCFDLGADPEVIGKGENKDDFVRNIIGYFERQGQLQRLYRAAQRERPHAQLP